MFKSKIYKDNPSISLKNVNADLMIICNELNRCIYAPDNYIALTRYVDTISKDNTMTINDKVIFATTLFYVIEDYDPTILTNIVWIIYHYQREDIDIKIYKKMTKLLQKG